MIGDFFIWCAGSDKSVLSKCSDAERTKHIGFGTLVLIPAVLAFISMAYALSTITIVNNVSNLNYIGACIWALIIFAIDRFIVSTHRRKSNNSGEFKNINLYLRLVFAFFLGVASSHPFVLLYFNDSIKEEILIEKNNNISDTDSTFKQSSDTLRSRIHELESHKQCLEKLLTAEQSGNKVELECGYSSGIPNLVGSFPRTQEIKRLIKADSVSIKFEEQRISKSQENLERFRDEKKGFYEAHTSFDYLKRETTLSKLKSGNSIISYTQWVLMIVFVFLDISAVIFKTFAPFGMYDKILTDDIDLLKNINTDSRQQVLQHAYEDISSVYADAKNINKKPEEYKNLFNTLSSKYHLQKNVLIGLAVGFLSFLSVLYFFGSKISSKEIWIFVLSSIIIGLITNGLTELIKYMAKK